MQKREFILEIRKPNNQTSTQFYSKEEKEKLDKLILKVTEQTDIKTTNISEKYSVQEGSIIFEAEIFENTKIGDNYFSKGRKLGRRFEGSFHVTNLPNEESRASLANNTVGFISVGNGDIIIDEDLRGFRIGTYFLSQIINFLQNTTKIFSSQKIKMPTLHLSGKDRQDEENRKRRNRLYEQIGYLENGIQKNEVYLEDLKYITTWKENIIVYDSVDIYLLWKKINENEYKIDKLEKYIEKIDSKCKKKWHFWIK